MQITTKKFKFFCSLFCLILILGNSVDCFWDLIGIEMDLYDDFDYSNLEHEPLDRKKTKNKKGIKKPLNQKQARIPNPRKGKILPQNRNRDQNGDPGLFGFLSTMMGTPSVVNNGGMFFGPVQYNNQNNIHNYNTMISNVYDPTKLQKHMNKGKKPKGHLKKMLKLKKKK